LAGRADIEFIEDIAEVDTYFNHPCRDFAIADEALRIRNANDAIRLTWKAARLDEISQTRREVEVAISSGGTETLDELLRALGFQPVIVVQKIRRAYFVSELAYDVSLCVDRVTGRAPYVELEVMCLNETARLSAINILETLAILSGLVEVEPRTYLELLVPA